MAFTYDNKARTAWSTSNPVTVSFTCGASAKLLVVTLTYDYNASGRGGGAPTYNGIALTQADRVRNHSASPEVCAEIWYLPAPPTGSAYDVSVPNPNSRSLEVVVSSYNTASGYCAVLHKETGGNGLSTNPSVTLTSTIISLYVAVVGDGDNGFAPTARSGTSLYENNNGSTFGSGHQYFIQTAAGSKAMSWTEGTSEDWGCCVALFHEVRQGVDVSKTGGSAVLGPPKGVAVAKTGGSGVLSPPKGISVSKVGASAVLEGDIKVAQVAEEIVYTTDAAPVQVAQAAEEIVFTNDLAQIQVAQVAQEIVLADWLQAQVAQVATEAMIQPTSQQAQVAQAATEVMVQPTSQQAQVAQVAYEVMMQLPAMQVAQSAFEVLVQGTPDIQAAQSAFEVLVQGTPDIQVAQSAFEVLVENATTGQVAQVATEVIIKAELGPQNADVAQVATEIIAQNPPRATLAHTATEVLLQNLTRAHVAHTAIEIIAENKNAARVSHTAVEVISPMGSRGIVAHTATEVLIKNMNWVRTAHVATEVPMPGPAGAPGDTLVTQMKLSVLQEGGGIVRGSQVTRATTIRADEDLMVSHVVRAVVIHKKRDFWPALLRMMGSD